jgi:hypothetical protein
MCCYFCWNNIFVCLFGLSQLPQVDCDVEQDLMNAQGIRGFPTLLLYRHDHEPLNYAGVREVEHMVNWLIQQGALPKDFKYDKTELKVGIFYDCLFIVFAWTLRM